MAMEYFYELFEELPRQGPGCKEATLRALGLLKDLPAKPRVLDIGCGCGLQTQILAQELKFKNAGVAEAEAVYAGCEAEIEMFRRHSKSYGYVFFVLQRI